MQLTLQGEDVYVGTAGSDNQSADSPAVVFVHGAGFDHSVWVMPMRYFARHGYRVVSPDLPGHGRSTGPALSSIDAISEWLNALLVQLDTAQAAIVGHSMGSLVANTMACRYPDKLRALALLGTSAPMPVTPLLLNAAADNHHAAIEMANTWSHSAQGRMGAVGTPGTYVFGAAERLLERMAPGVYHTDFAACNDYDASSLPSPKQCPTLVLAGTKDQMTPVKAGMAVADNLPGALRIALPGCGHAMLAEQPNAVLDALRQVV